MLKYRKSLSIILIMCILFCIVFDSSKTAQAKVTNKNKIYYYDGQAYKVSVNNNGDILLRTVKTGRNSASMTVHSDGTAEAEINNNYVTEEYSLDINELNREEIDIDIYDKKSRKVEKIDDYRTLKHDFYKGQTATASFLIFSLSLLIEVLITLALLVVIGTVTYYSIVTVIDIVQSVADERVRNKQPQLYYNANIQGPQVAIDYNNPINETVAVNRLRGGASTYTFFSGSALAITKLASGGPSIGAEINQERIKGYIYFYHFHLNRYNPAHSFFGFPFTA